MKNAVTALEAHDRRFVMFALNNFGGGGPVASEGTLQFFGQEHVVKCLKLACECHEVAGKARLQGRSIIGALCAK